MWDAHSATGIVIGLALFVIFVSGALVLFRGEIRQWEEPALRTSPGERASLDALTGPVLDSLNAGDSPPSYVQIGLPDTPGGSLYMYVAGGTVGGPQSVWVNPTTGRWVTNPDEGAATQTLYYLHFFYQFGRWGMYLVGVIGLFMLLAITTGTAVHLNRAVKDFFQFRSDKKLRVAWADAHKVLGTIGLPFQAMYAFTGAYLGLLALLALPYASLLFGGSAADFYRATGHYAPSVSVDSVEVMPTASPSLERLTTQAEATWPRFEPKTMIVSKRGQPDSRVEIIGRTRGTVFAGTGSIVFHGATGEVLHQQPPSEAGMFNDLVQSTEVLHFATFGGSALKILFLLLTLASSAVILTGNFTWLEVRRKQDRVLHTILARLTAGVATGMAPALVLLFLSARWKPDGLPSPDGWTDLVFFGSWGLGVVYALARSNIARTHRALLTLGGLLALLIPLANGFTTGAWPWVAWTAQQWSVLSVDVGAVLSGLALLGLAACLDVEAVPSDGGRAKVHG
jgi:uncharacterized iron-regulated membrane protein